MSRLERVTGYVPSVRDNRRDPRVLDAIIAVCDPPGSLSLLAQPPRCHDGGVAKELSGAGVCVCCEESVMAGCLGRGEGGSNPPSGDIVIVFPPWWRRSFLR
jgi:hypothetical protein